MNFIKNLFQQLIRNEFLCRAVILEDKTEADQTIKWLFMKFIFWVWPEGPTGYFFDKNKNSRKDLNTYTSAQFSMLVQNMTLVLIQFIFFMIEIYQVLAKKT
jgi:hypothetical protein